MKVHTGLNPVLATKINNMNDLLVKLKEQRDELNKQIANLEKQELQTSTSFVDRLKIWYESESGEDLPYIPDKEKYPALHEYIDDIDADRYRTYDLREYFEDEILTIIEKGEDTELVKPLIVEVLKEAMENNVSSFTMDW